MLDEILSRLKLDWLSDRTKHDLASVIDLIARHKAMTGTEAAMNAAAKLVEAEESHRYQEGVRAFDNVGLNMTSLVMEQEPNAAKEVEAELGFLYDASRLGAIGTDDERKIVENTIRIYSGDMLEFLPYLQGKFGEYGAIVANNLIIADGYRRAGDEEQSIEHLLRAQEYVGAWEASSTQLEVYRLLKRAANEFGAKGRAAEYESSYLECDAYLSLSEKTKDALFRDDPFSLFVKYFQVEPAQVGEWRAYFNASWYASLSDRCDPWLTLAERETASNLREQPEQWQGYLRARVYNFDELYNEQRVRELIKLLAKLAEDKVFETDSISLSDYLAAKVRLIAMHSQFYQADEDGPVAPAQNSRQPDPAEYEGVLEEIRRSWTIVSTDERLRSAAAAAVFPAFVPLVLLEQDSEFCAQIGKEAETDGAVTWIHSLMRCWCADVLKGRRGNDDVRTYLATLPSLNGALRESPPVVIAMVALSLFWSRLSSQLDPALIQSLTTLSVSTDNLEAMIEQLRGVIPRKDVSPAGIVSEMKDELFLVHTSLLADFES